MWRSSGSSGRDLLQPGLEGRHRLRTQWADVFMADGAVRADDKGFGDPVDPPVDGGAALRVEAYGRIGVAERAEEAAGVVRVVALVDPDDANRRVLGQFDEKRMLLSARPAPGRPDIHHGGAALEVLVREPGHRTSVGGEAFERRQVEDRRRFVDERRGHLRGIAAAEAEYEEQGEPDEDCDRQYEQEPPRRPLDAVRVHDVTREERRPAPRDSRTSRARRCALESSTARTM